MQYRQTNIHTISFSFIRSRLLLSILINYPIFLFQYFFKDSLISRVITMGQRSGIEEVSVDIQGVSCLELVLKETNKVFKGSLSPSWNDNEMSEILSFLELINRLTNMVTSSLIDKCLVKSSSVIHVGTT